MWCNENFPLPTVPYSHPNNNIYRWNNSNNNVLTLRLFVAVVYDFSQYFYFSCSKYNIDLLSKLKFILENETFFTLKKQDGPLNRPHLDFFSVIYFKKIASCFSVGHPV